MNDGFKGVFDLISASFLEHDCLKTGSRLYGDWNDESDFDIVVLMENMSAMEIVSRYHSAGMGFSFHGGTQTVLSVRNEKNINLLIVTKRSVFETWKMFNAIVTRCGMNKPTRVMVAQMLMESGHYSFNDEKCYISGVSQVKSDVITGEK